MIDRNLGRYSDRAYALLRFVCGALFALHGLRKFGFLDGEPARVFSQLWFGGAIELGAGVLMAVGLFVRPAALLASGTMAVAYVQFHWKGQFGQAFWPFINKGELTLVYCLVFLFIAAHGARAYSFDKLRSRRFALR
ncbi:MAG: DoxX family protein [Myxococcaceae bacterium]